MGWAGIKNGTLLRLAEEQFDVFLTVDQNLTFQQNLTGLALCIVTLRAKSNDIDDLCPLMPRGLERLPAARPGEIIRVR